MSETDLPSLDNIISENPDQPYHRLKNDEFLNIDLDPFLEYDPLNSDHKDLTDEEEDTRRRSYWYVESCEKCSKSTFKKAGIWSYISHVRCQIRLAAHLVTATNHGMSKSEALAAAFENYEVIDASETYAERRKRRAVLQPTPKVRSRTPVGQHVHVPLQIATIDRRRPFDADHACRVLEWARDKTTQIMDDVMAAMRPLKALHSCINTLHEQITNNRYNSRASRHHPSPFPQDRDRDHHRGNNRHQD